MKMIVQLQEHTSINWLMNYLCSDWCVGSEFDEECSEMHYAVWFVRFREPSETSMQIVLPDNSRVCARFSVNLANHIYSRSFCVCTIAASPADSVLYFIGGGSPVHMYTEE